MASSGQYVGFIGDRFDLGTKAKNKDFAILLLARALMSGARALSGVIAAIYLSIIGFNAFEIGMVFLAIGIFSAVLSSLIGLVSDQFGTKPFLVVIPLFACLAGASFAFSDNHVLLILMATLGTFGRGAGAGAGAVGPYQPAESSLLLQISGHKKRNKAFAMMASASAFGAVVGGILSAVMTPGTHVVHSALAAYRDAFLATAVLAGLAGAVAIALNPDSGRLEESDVVDDLDAGREETESAAAVKVKRSIKFPHKSKPLLYRLWLTNGINGLGVGFFGPFVSYWFYKRFNLSTAEIGYLFVILNAVTMFSTLSASRVAKYFGIIKATVYLRTVQGILLIPLALSPNVYVAGAVFLVRSLVQRMSVPLRQSYVLAMADETERASVAALSNFPSQVAMSASPVLAGYIYDEISLAIPFEIAGVLQLINSIVYWEFFKNTPPEDEVRKSVQPSISGN
ncbi:MAG: MFS transporter [Firmicutes bacterium]|nr:MFS transporter [Bacillota bacterium]